MHMFSREQLLPELTHPRRSAVGCLCWLGLLLPVLLARAAETDITGASNARQPVADLRVYIYPLPEHFQSLSTVPGHYDYSSYLYGAELRAPEALQEAGYTAKSPAQADFLFVPAYFYAITGHKAMQLKDSGMSLQRQATNIVLDYVRTQYPYWNASLGRDHIWTLTTDQGFCGFSQFGETHDELASSVILSHWGLTKPEVPCGLEERIATFGRCRERQEVEALAALGHHKPLSRPCFIPKKDVVIPCTQWDDLKFVPIQLAPAVSNRASQYDPVKDDDEITGEGHTLYALHSGSESTAEEPLLNAESEASATSRHAIRHHKHRSTQPAAAMSRRDESSSSTASPLRRQLLQGHPVKRVESISPVKNHTLFFAGGVLEERPEYSHGVRQTIVKLFRNEPGFFLKEKKDSIDPLGPEEMFREMGRSHFCLAATGFGFGVRLKLGIMLECIPLIIHDDVQVPFEDILPYQDFAIRIPFHMIYQLPHILKTVLADEKRVLAMRSRLACAATFFSWEAQTGQAVHALACALLKKVQGPDAVVPLLHWHECRLECIAPPR